MNTDGAKNFCLAYFVPYIRAVVMINYNLVPITNGWRPNNWSPTSSLHSTDYSYFCSSLPATLLLIFIWLENPHLLTVSTNPVLVAEVTGVYQLCDLLCVPEAATSQKYKRIFLGRVSRVLNVSLFINLQLFLSCPRKKKTEPLHSCLEISCSDQSYVQFQQPCPICVLSSTSHSLRSYWVGC